MNNADIDGSGSVEIPVAVIERLSEVKDYIKAVALINDASTNLF